MEQILKKLLGIGKYYLVAYEKWLFYEHSNKYRLINTIKRIQITFGVLNQRRNITLNNLIFARQQLRRWMVSKRPWRYIKSPDDTHTRMMRELRYSVKRQFRLLLKLLEKHISLFKRADYFASSMSKTPIPHTLTFHNDLI